MNESGQPGRDDETAAQNAVRAWPSWKRVLGRMGLQGKLILCFMGLIILTLGACCWIFAYTTTARLNDMLGDQARQIAYTLSLASKPALAANDTGELLIIGQDLLKSRNVLFVVFLDADNKPIATASRDVDFDIRSLHRKGDMASLLMVRELSSPLFGQFFEVVAPVVQLSNRGTKLLGYVCVGLSREREAAAVQRINYFIIGIGCVMTMLSLPLAYALVHRVFFPIRQLLLAANRIASGDLDARVAIDRPDIIGMLARAFNDMVKRVKHQQDLLADANNRLEEANLDLEQKVLQRTGELERANKRLSSEIEEKEDFLRAVSHDLNAPLRNISGMTTMLLSKNREKFDNDVIHRLERIQKNVEAETDLIAELLELSRIKTRRQRMEAVNLHELVRDLAGMFENDLKSRTIQLILKDRLPTMVCERARIRQVFQNLIDNAIKYMGDSKERKIYVGFTLGDDEAEFFVRDTGIGIESDDLPKVFHVFRRGKSSEVQSVAGKGVGLSLVKSIVETYQGRIWVESEHRKGSNFRFTIARSFIPATPKETDELLKLAMEESMAGTGIMGRVEQAA